MVLSKASTDGLGDEYLCELMFANLNETRNTIEEWMIDYNTNRPQTSFNGLTPSLQLAPTGAEPEQTLLMSEGKQGNWSCHSPGTSSTGLRFRSGYPVMMRKWRNLPSIARTS